MESLNFCISTPKFYAANPSALTLTAIAFTSFLQQQPSNEIIAEDS